MITECPCKKCISYAICIRPYKIIDLIYNCSILTNYINNMERVYTTIKTLIPSYYVEADTDNMFSYEPSARAILEAAALERDVLFKEGIE